MSRNKEFSTSFIILGVLELLVGIGLITCAIIIGINAPQLLDYSPYGGPGNNGNPGGEPDIYDIAAPIASGAWTGVAAILLSCFAFASTKLQSNGMLTFGMAFAIVVCILNLACIGVEVWGTDFMWHNWSTYENNYSGPTNQPPDDDVICNVMRLLFNTHIGAAILAFLSLVIAIVHSTYCCRATCCGGNDQTSQKQQVSEQPPEDFSSKHEMSSTAAPPYQASPSAPPVPALNIQQEYEQQYNSELQPPPYSESTNMASIEVYMDD